MAKKPYKGPAMEGRIAEWYARNTRGDARHRDSAAALAARLPAGARVLDVAPGPGYFAIELARRGDLRLSGLDISESLVRIARDNARAAGVTIDFRHGDAAHMPFADGAFDFVVCQAAFKSFSDPRGALDEIYRVLAPGGVASIQDLRKEASPQEIAAYVARKRLSRLDALWTRLVFRTLLSRNAYGEDALRQLAAQSRFGGGELTRDGIGFELRLVRPGLHPGAGAAPGAAAMG